MTKQLEKTPELTQVIRDSIDDQEIDTSNFAIFECRMLSTEPISQKGFYSGARTSRLTLVESADYVNEKGTNVPLQIMHEGKMLPVGRVFNASVIDLPNGESELRGKFYISTNTEFESDLVKKIESSVIDEVSVGLLAKHAYCSECGFDFFGEEADFFNIITQTCENDHTIGKDGIHLRLVGMDVFAELSLVGRGAARDAKILSRAKQSGAIDKETIERLAASGIPLEAHVLNTSFKMNDYKLNSQGDKPMSGLETLLAETSGKLGKTEAELSQANEMIKSLNSKVTELQASVKEKDEKLVSLEADKDTDVTELKASKEKVEEQLSEASKFIFEDLKAALIASGEKEDKVPEDLVAMLSLVREKGLKLHQLFGAEPKVDNKKTDVKAENSANRRVSNFKIND